MMNREASVHIGDKDAGATVLAFLSRRFTYHDRAEWRDLIRQGRVRRNGSATEPDVILRPKDIVAYSVGFEKEPPVCLQYHILHEDDDLLVVNKPGNLPCHPGGRYFKHTLWSLLKSERSLATLSFINRIDRETSGIVLIAKSTKSASVCGRQFASGSVRKRYVVAVFGNFPASCVCSQGWLCRDENSPVRKKKRFIPREASSLPPAGGKACRTDFKLLKQANGLSLLSAIPATGRMHQIRATLFSLGYPVVGDKLYGPDDTLFLRFITDQLTETDRDILILSRQALHAECLIVRHPVTRCTMRWIARLPEDMACLFHV